MWAYSDNFYRKMITEEYLRVVNVMFLNTFKSDIIRCFNLKKIIFILLAFVAVLLGGQAQYIQICSRFSYEETHGVVEILGNALLFDKFKIVLVVLLAALHANSFCKDDNTHYLRMILNRTNIVYYTWARFLTNMTVVMALSVLGFILSAAVLLPFFPIISLLRDYDCYYKELALNYPFLYIIFMGFQFGIVVAAFSSIGLAFSAFQPNAFVSIGIAGLVFFLSASYIPPESVFDVLPLISMIPSFIKSTDASQILNASWSIFYPVLVIMASGYIFYRRLDWRLGNGNI